MRVFVYEWMTATGTGRDPASPAHGMYLEGRAMRDALVADLLRSGADAQCPPDATPFWHADLEELGKTSPWDWVVLIAPELGGALGSLERPVARAGRRLLGPSSEATGLCSDKLALAAHWREHGVPTPATTSRNPTTCEPFPVVWKPRDGAGSTNVYLLNSALDLVRVAAQRAAQPSREYEEMLLQEFVPGRAASVAFLCGPNEYVALAPTFQLLSDDGRFEYQGGELPIQPELAERAVKLARRAVGCVPGLLGYVGVDVVLGEEADGSRDFAIEINPRLTTSYIGLRALAEFNLAQAMLKVAAGEGVGELKWKANGVRFDAAGAVYPC